MPEETKHVQLRWVGGMRFDGGAPDGPQLRIDGDNETGPGPMSALLLAAAACTASDIVLILEKMRVALTEFTMEADGVRREQEPRRYLSMHLRYHLRGEGLDETKARRAIDLSIEKYCSVMHSLAPDIRVTYDVSLA